MSISTTTVIWIWAGNPAKINRSSFTIIVIRPLKPRLSIMHDYLQLKLSQKKIN